ncbi:haloacid dehalogenase type II [Sphingomonas radiodurans]|uniref:haloacid dehalogenase type II n=1 Tax=Sphingomonas radiodurans TaxID=2890321 RepID=UPI001E36D74F|nr:haloacid dehalogenase type II [Sphingomonas radiodurans]WBH17871.1 haloacid dehalogenase type II [Sphingomonas radiodurans]
MADSTAPKVLAFDVFGTVVDWRSSIAAESVGFLQRIGRADIDAFAFTDAWRFRYLSVMKAFAASGRGFTVLDVLHREMLDETLLAEGIDPASLDEEWLRDWTFAWRRLTPWPDTVEGLTRLKRGFPLVSLSNGNIALMMEMARRGGLPWDAILGAEVTRAYKPDPRAYLGTAEILGVEPGEVCLVAAHHSDLAAARACGLGTAYIARPDEYGGRRAPDIKAAEEWDWSADSLIALAEQLGC